VTFRPGSRVQFRARFWGRGQRSPIGHSIRTARTSLIGSGMGSGMGSGKRCLWEGRTGICIGTGMGSARPSRMPQDSREDCLGACPGQGDPKLTRDTSHIPLDLEMADPPLVARN
jgi:hypothetical protein